MTRRPTNRPPNRPVSVPAMPAVDYDVLSVARRVVEGALTLSPGDRLVLLVERAQQELREGLEEAGRWRGVEMTSWVVEELTSRPMRKLPDSFVRSMEQTEASIFLASDLPDELDARKQIAEIVARHSIRHAHMIGVTKDVLVKGLAVDPARIGDVTRSLRGRIRGDSTLSVRCAAGTDMTVKLSPQHRWVENTGVIRSGRWANLPAGEIITAPASVDGVYVCDSTMTGRVGLHGSTPVRVELEGGRVVGVECRSAPPADHVRAFMRHGPNQDRIGTISLGTNIGLTEPTGHMIADKTLPGIHLALGTTRSELTGASWDAREQLLLSAGRCDVDLDGAAVMRAGRYLL